MAKGRNSSDRGKSVSPASGKKLKSREWIKSEINRRFAKKDGLSPVSSSAASKRSKKFRKPEGKPVRRQKKPAQEITTEAAPVLERLQKFMAHRGVGSRRKCEEMILADRVKVNGTVIRELGCKVDPVTDKVVVDGKPLSLRIRHHYVAINKPAGYITACSDQHGSKLVIDLLPKKLLKVGVVPIGRLDKITGGLLLLTNDGEMAHRLTHPSYSVWKTYRVSVKGNPTRREYRQLEEGVEIEGGITAPARVKEIKKSKGRAVIMLSIHEGRNRQVRKMCKTIGHPVLELFRSRVGTITIGRLRPGEYRNLTEAEIAKLKKSVGLK